MLRGRRVVLRRLEERDLPAVLAWDNDEEIIRTMGQKFATHAQCQEWFAEARAGRLRRVLAIEDEAGLLIGELELENFNPKAGSVELSICIGEPDYRSRGYGSEAIGLVRDYIFDRTRLRQIYLRVYQTNVRAIRCYEKCGFIKEGVLKVSRRQAERTGEVVLMSLTRARTA